MQKITIKKEKTYKPILDFFKTEQAIKLTKDTFEHELAEQLNLIRVTAPRFLPIDSGLQDDLAGTQTPVSFKAKGIQPTLEIVHSLAKWKRFTLGKHKFATHTGLYTDMDAIRKDEDPDEIHSIYVDQWDWEKVIEEQNRNSTFLKEIVEKIYQAIKKTEDVVTKQFPQLKKHLPEKITFIQSQDLEDLYPDKTSKEREKLITKKFGAVFLIGIGHPLTSGKSHDVRASDYDDWSTPTSKDTFGLNGDILVWDDVRKDVLELSSMGIRVNAAALLKQVTLMNQEHILKHDFHQKILIGTLPLSIGGGIGQSRLCMFLLQKTHIGEVQSSTWPEDINLPLL